MPKTKKFTNEELSRILSHANDLEPFGTCRDYEHRCAVGCINQAAYNIGASSRALLENVEVAKAFDRTDPRRDHWAPTEILRFLEKLGAA